MKITDVSKLRGPLNQLNDELLGENGEERLQEFLLWQKRVGFGYIIKVSPKLIRVDRTVRPTYPSWVKEILHPELEATGPAGFDSKKLELWLHDEQKTGIVKGQVIYDHLKMNNMLQSCLGLRDLGEIQKKGVAHFRKHFRGKVVFGWKSVVRGDDGSLNVSCLVENGSSVELSWDSLGFLWGYARPALRFT